MPEKNEKQQLEFMESAQSVERWKNYGGKDFVEKMSFEPGVEERRNNEW